jgi:hypothetical protein
MKGDYDNMPACAARKTKPILDKEKVKRNKDSVRRAQARSKLFTAKESGAARQ